ncbi:MAG: DUF934 domain-containing protein [Usitatibacter sp.]
MLPDRVIRISGEDARVEPELWRYAGLPGEDETALPTGPVVEPLAAWLEKRSELVARPEPVGVWLNPDDDPAQIAADLAHVALVAVHFPKFADGRGYSTAFLLRTRHGYKGELRAIGDVGRDQLFLLKRCGFDSFALAPHRDPEAALASLNDFSLRYQGSVDDARSLFRHRADGDLTA